MGGDDKTSRTGKQSNQSGKKPSKQINVSEAEISSLLKHFNSAELFCQSGENQESKKTSAKGDAVCEDIVTPFKHLHVRRPELRKHRKATKSSKSKKCPPNLLNLAIAAGNFEKPIVRPARLSCGCKKHEAPLLHPPKLKAPCKPSVKNTGKSSDATWCCACTVDNSIAGRKGQSGGLTGKLKHAGASSPQFGATSGASSLSFTGLCAQQGQAKLVHNNLTKVDTPSGNQCSVLHQLHDPQFTGEQLFSQTPLRPLQASALLRAEALYSLPSTNQNPVESTSSLYSTLSFAGSNSYCASSSAAPWSSSRAPQQPGSMPSASGGPPPGRSCSQEVRDMEDTNVNELASYLEDLLHIPKKMSSMAEMMYA